MGSRFRLPAAFTTFALMKRFLRILLALFLLLNLSAVFHAWKFTHFYPSGQFRNKLPEQMNALEKTKTILLGVRISKSRLKHTPATTYKTVHLHTSDNLTLEGWWITVPNAKGSVVLFHGYNGAKDGPLPEADYFRSLGYNTFLLDFRAHGNSEGSACTVGYKEAEDVQLAYNYAKEAGKAPVILWGVSMGASAILRAVPAFGLQPKALILEAPFATLTDAVKGRMRAVGLPGTPLSQLLTFWGGLEHGFWGFSYQPAADAKEIKLPTLLNWGTDDNRVMRTETDAIYRNLGTKHKRLVIFEQSGHQSFCRNEGSKWKKQVKEFLAGIK
jgi:uncharacterized protein